MLGLVTMCAAIGVGAEEPAAPSPGNASFLGHDLGREYQRLQHEEGDAAALAFLLGHEAAHSDEVAYNYHLGVLALRSRQYGIALNAFERVVLQQPAHAGAWLDLAIASFHLGDDASAEQLFLYVRTHFDPPPPVLQTIEEYRHLLAERAMARRTWQAQLGTALGWTDNANSGPALDKIQLTSGGQRYDIALDPRQHPRPAHFLQADALLRWAPEAIAVSGLGFLFYGQQRRNAGIMSDFNQGVSIAAANIEQPLGPYTWGAQLAMQDFRLGQARLYRAQVAELALRRETGPCQLQAGLEAERRRYGDMPDLDGDIHSLRLGGECRLAYPGHILGLLLRTSRDLASRQRAGGEQRRHEILVSYRHPLGPGRLEYSARSAQQADAEGYSPLLEDGARRRVTRSQWALAFVLPLGLSQEWYLSAQYYKQQSNIPLFTQSTTTLQTGWRWLF